MSVHIHTSTCRCTHTDRHAHCHVNRHVSLTTQGKKNANAPLFKSVTWHPWGDECLPVWEKGGDGEERERERFRELDGTGSLYIWCVSSCPHALCCERTCLSGSENRCNSLRRIWLCHQSSSVYGRFSFLFFLYPSFQVWHALAVLEDECKLCCIFSLFHSLQSSFLWVPCCSSCRVRLQVVWEQDLSKHMRSGETLWLTWLLGERDGQ